MIRIGVHCSGAFPQGRTSNNRKEFRSSAPGKRNAGSRESGALLVSECTDIEICDLFLEQSVKVESRAKTNEGASKPNRGAIHEDKLSGRPYSAELLEPRV